MTTAKNSPPENIMVALPAGTKVYIQGLGVRAVLESRVQRGNLQYLVDRPSADWRPARQCTLETVPVPAPPTSPAPPSILQSLPAQAKEASPDDGRDVPMETRHDILTDAQYPNPKDQVIYKTPGGLRARQAQARVAIFGADTAAHPLLSNLTTSQDRGCDGLARLSVTEYSMDVTGLRVSIKVSGKLAHVAVPHDLIEVELTRPLLREGERPDDQSVETLLVLTPPVNHNITTFDVFYTWQQLAQLLHLPDSGFEAGSAVHRMCPQLGIQALWYDSKTGRNAVNHTSGGTKQKNGSGLLALRAITPEERKRSEMVRNTDWNLYEVLRENRPVYASHKQLLQPGMQMATTLEAESEFLVSPTQYQQVLARLAALKKSEQTWEKFGIKLIKGGGEKTSKDSYYDNEALTLLRQAVVLRRREVFGDDPGTFLFAVKGRTVSRRGQDGERIRLSSQVHLIEGAPQSLLENFLADVSTDNAFARILADAVSGPRGTRFDPRGVAPRLIVHSTRTKYEFELENSTTIDFSADTTYAEYGGTRQTVNCIEFGVGHPGLIISAPTQRPESLSASGSGGRPVPDLSDEPLFARPYHVPEDLDNENLFIKRDYQQYQALRDVMLAYLFEGDERSLEPGGNKAHLLAGRLGMLGS